MVFKQRIRKISCCSLMLFSLKGGIHSGSTEMEPRTSLAFRSLGQAKLDAITSDKITAYIANRRQKGLQVASINRELQVLRRMLRVAVEWGKLEKVLPKVELLSGERRRDRVLTSDEEREYFRAAQMIGEDIETAHCRA
jgi:site-specific recombinase XerD